MSGWPKLSALSAGVWDEVGDVELGSDAAAITVSGISTAYRLFRVSVYCETASGTSPSLGLRLNNDSGTNYHNETLNGASSTISETEGATDAQIMQPGVVALSAGESAHIDAIVGKSVAGTRANAVSAAAYKDAASIQAAVTGSEWNNTADLISRIDAVFGANVEAGARMVVEGFAA